MILTSSRGIKGPQWLVNEMLQVDDVNYIHQSFYGAVTDMLAMLTSQEAANEVIFGFLLLEDTGLDVDVAPGGAISFDGMYYTGQIWAFSASAGDIFSVVNPTTDSITFDTGVGQGGLDRIDTVEVRPARSGWDSQTRPFKDPVTEIITSSNMSVKVEYVMEIQILKGTPGGSPTAPTATAGWIKIGEVSVDDGQSTVVQANIADARSSAAWSTEADSTIVKPQRRVGSGTSFPAYPIFGDEFYRTDSDKWYKYNSLVWTEI